MGHKVKYLFPLCLVLFIDSIGTGLALPILPELFLNSQYGLVSGYNSSISNFLYGLSLAVVPLSSLIGLSFFGALSDVHGRKSMIIVGLIGIFISYLISILSILFGSIFLFIFSRIIIGINIGTYSVVYAMVSDISDPMADQMLSYRWTTLAFVLGFIIGPLLGGTSTFFDGQYSLLLPFMIGGFLTGINIIVVLKFLPESYSHYSKVIKKDNLFIKIKNILVDNVSVVRNHNLANLSISYGFIQFSFGLYFQSISLYFAVYLNYGSGKLSFFM